MRRVVSIVMPLMLCFSVIGHTAAAKEIQIARSGSVIAASDSSGVSITIEQSSMTSTTVNGTGTLVIAIESSAGEGTTYVCTLTPSGEGGKIRVDANGDVDVVWAVGNDEQISIDLPSIRIAGTLSNFECEAPDA